MTKRIDFEPGIYMDDDGQILFEIEGHGMVIHWHMPHSYIDAVIERLTKLKEYHAGKETR